MADLITSLLTRRLQFTGWLSAKIDSLAERNPRDLLPLVGSLIICDPQHQLVAPAMSELLDHDWNMRELFC